MLVLREVERRLGVAERLTWCLDDPRDPALITQSLAEMVRFRMLKWTLFWDHGLVLLRHERRVRKGLRGGARQHGYRLRVRLTTMGE